MLYTYLDRMRVCQLSVSLARRSVPVDGLGAVSVKFVRVKEKVKPAKDRDTPADSGGYTGSSLDFAVTAK